MSVDCIHKVISQNGNRTWLERLSTPRPATRVTLRSSWHPQQHSSSKTLRVFHPASGNRCEAPRCKMWMGRMRTMQQKLSSHPASGNRCETLHHLLKKSQSAKSSRGSIPGCHLERRRSNEGDQRNVTEVEERFMHNIHPWWPEETRWYDIQWRIKSRDSRDGQHGALATGMKPLWMWRSSPTRWRHNKQNQCQIASFDRDVLSCSESYKMKEARRFPMATRPLESNRRLERSTGTQQPSLDPEQVAERRAIHNFPVGDWVDRKLLPSPGLPHDDRHLPPRALSPEESVRLHHPHDTEGTEGVTGSWECNVWSLFHGFWFRSAAHVFQVEFSGEQWDSTAWRLAWWCRGQKSACWERMAKTFWRPWSRSSTRGWLRLYSHTRTLSRCVCHISLMRTPHGSRYDESLCVCSKNHSFIDRVFVGCSLDSIPSCVFFTFHLADNTSDLSSALSWYHSKPLCNSARAWMESLADWLVRSQTQVMTPSSASM